jgi:hypothetical protein
MNEKSGMSLNHGILHIVSGPILFDGIASEDVSVFDRKFARPNSFSEQIVIILKRISKIHPRT